MVYAGVRCSGVCLVIEQIEVYLLSLHPNMILYVECTAVYPVVIKISVFIMVSNILRFSIECTAVYPVVLNTCVYHGVKHTED